MIHKFIDLGTETRNIECVQDRDKIYFVETTSGDLTKDLFGCNERIQSVTFKPIDEFGIDDIQMVVDDHDDAIFFDRVIEALDFWGIDYKVEKKPMP